MTKEESRSKWSKESDQKTQRKGNDSSNKEFLGKCFKCGEIGHRSYECSLRTDKGMARNFIACEEPNTRVVDENMIAPE